MITYYRKKKKDGKPYWGEDGRKKVYLIDRKGVGTEHDLAYIVAVTFPEIVGEPKEGLPKFKDGNPNNCAAANLYWE